MVLSWSVRNSTAHAGNTYKVWNTPQGIPHKTCPATSIGSEFAKTMMKMKPVRAMIDTCMTILGPYLSAAQPLIYNVSAILGKKRQGQLRTIKPMIPPAELPLLRPDCQSAGIA